MRERQYQLNQRVVALAGKYSLQPTHVRSNAAVAESLAQPRPATHA